MAKNRYLLVEKIQIKTCIPIFVIVKDRLECLKKSTASWEKQIATPIEIVYIDQQSTYPPTVDYLKKNNAKVIWNIQNLNPKTGKTDNNHFWLNWPQIIKDHLNQMPDYPPYYCVSDPDILFYNVPEDVLEIYATLLEAFDVACVGPQLDIDDIDESNISKFFIVDFWTSASDKTEIHSIKIDKKMIDYQLTSIDTTFAIFKSGQPYQCPKEKTSIRVRKPYSAKHLDWYLDYKNMSPDQTYYLGNYLQHNGISHFGTSWLLKNIKAAQYKFCKLPGKFNDPVSTAKHRWGRIFFVDSNGDAIGLVHTSSLYDEVAAGRFSIVKYDQRDWIKLISSKDAIVNDNLQ